MTDPAYVHGTKPTADAGCDCEACEAWRRWERMESGRQRNATEARERTRLSPPSTGSRNAKALKKMPDLNTSDPASIDAWTSLLLRDPDVPPALKVTLVSEARKHHQALMKVQPDLGAGGDPNLPPVT